MREHILNHLASIENGYSITEHGQFIEYWHVDGDEPDSSWTQCEC